MCEPVLYSDQIESCEYPLGLCAAGYYVVVMLGGKCDASTFGRCPHDFQEATLLFLAPSCAEVFASEATRCPAERMLAFDPAYFSCMGLSSAVREYAFFDYRTAEMLHLAAGEKRIVERCMQDIAKETRCKEDYFSCRLLAQQIRLLLDHCTRMYERQFITRDLDNRPLLALYEAFVTLWIESGRLPLDGEPSQDICAEYAECSPAYLRSLLQFEKGCTHAEYFQFRRLEIAKRLLMKGCKPLCEIAALLGFSSEDCFSRFFKKTTGYRPSEYRRMN